MNENENENENKNKINNENGSGICAECNIYITLEDICNNDWVNINNNITVHSKCYELYLKKHNMFYCDKCYKYSIIDHNYIRYNQENSNEFLTYHLTCLPEFCCYLCSNILNKDERVDILIDYSYTKSYHLSCAYSINNLCLNCGKSLLLKCQNDYCNNMSYSCYNDCYTPFDYDPGYCLKCYW
jgi:hypothetical protein